MTTCHDDTNHDDTNHDDNRPVPSVHRLLIANLDCEQDYANPRAPRLLPADVRRRIAAAGTLMAAFARRGDLLWTPEPVNGERALLARARGVRLVTGTLPSDTVRDVNDVLAWGETDRVREWRSQVATVARDDASDNPIAMTIANRYPTPDIARRCNDRRYALACNRAWGLTLPGAALLSSVEQLEQHLRAGGHRYGRRARHGDRLDEPTWVLEAPFSASGRFRLRRRGAHLNTAARTRARRLFDTFGELIFQPWVDRVTDIGCVGVITDDANWTIIGHHILETNDAGVFCGIVIGEPSTLPTSGQPTPGHPEHDVATTSRAVHTITQTASKLACQLAADGYRGPFGIDGFTYRDVGGDIHTHAMCEINARTTFGLLVHAMARAHGVEHLRMHIGAHKLPDASARVIPLLASDNDDPTCAWLALPGTTSATPRISGL